MSDTPVRFEQRDKIALVQLDDGRANALSHAVIEALHAALDRAEKEASAVLLVGRPGRFSGGFDLAVMRSGAEAVRGLVTAGAELLVRLFGFPQPVVTACTGHAVAAGALLLLASDTRIGAQGEFKIGLNEVGIGMALPTFAVELARQRLSKRHFQAATVQAQLFAPAAAVDAGFLDRVVGPDELLDVAVAEAARQAEVNLPAFSATKQRVRGAALDLIRETLADDMKRITGPTAGL